MDTKHSEIKSVLYYVHDPMCSWCWAFRPILLQLRNHLSEQIQWLSLLGGLAKDSSEPMPEQTKQFVQGQWHKIQTVVPNTKFNFDFWTQCQPRRSTYPACRAVIAAREQGIEFEQQMICAIQKAYYLEARNPSDLSTLNELAVEIGLDVNLFSKSLKSAETDQILLTEIKQASELGLNQFPSLLLEIKDFKYRIPIDYLNANNMIETIMQALANQEINFQMAGK